MKIIRTKTKAHGGITPAEKVRMDEHAQLWISRAMRTAPIEPDKIIPAIEGIYAAANLKKPRVIIVPSPMVMAFAYGASAAIWYARKQPTKTRDATDAATDAATRDATYAALASRPATSHASHTVTPFCAHPQNGPAATSEREVVARNIWEVDGPTYQGWPSIGKRVDFAYRDQYPQAWNRCLRIADAILASLPVGSGTVAERDRLGCEPQTLTGMIAAIYGGLDAEDCKWIDREWAKMRGYILPTNGSGTVAASLQNTQTSREGCNSAEGSGECGDCLARWRCFHCGEVFADEAEAKEHFGPDEEWMAGCIDPLTKDEKERRADQVAMCLELDREREENSRLTNRDYVLSCFERDLAKMFDGAKSVTQAYLVLDSMEGRALAAEEKLAALSIPIGKSGD